MKKIEFMDTSLRDGFQSVFGARALTDDFLPAIEAARAAGIHYMEAGGGARFQALFMYCGESAFDMMDRFRQAAGPDASLQTLAARDQRGRAFGATQGYDRSACAHVQKARHDPYPQL
jgi:pyruvate carboxylase subunit B